MRENDNRHGPTILQILTKSGLLYAIVLSLGGCSSALRDVSFCDVYIPVYTVEQDTDETRFSVNLNNAVWLGICKGEDITDE